MPTGDLPPTTYRSNPASQTGADDQTGADSPTGVDAATGADAGTGPSWSVPARLTVAVLVVGALTGLGAAALVALLHGVETIVYGHPEDHHGFVADGVPPWRYAVGVAGGSVLLALAWWLLRRRGPRLVAVGRVVEGERPPAACTVLNSALQIVAVGTGMPVGREVAPREVGALIADRFCSRLGLGVADRRILVAAAAGAGLAAVYQVPLGGAVFALELLLATATLRAGVVCLATAAVATLTAQVVVPSGPTYGVAAIGCDLRVVGVAAVVGLVVGPLGGWFGDLSGHVKARHVTDRRILLTLPAAGLAVAGMSLLSPYVLGNGKAVAQASFDLELGLGLAALLVLLRALATLLTLRAGAVGGTLAPAVAIGATAGLALGHAAAALQVLPVLPLGGGPASSAGALLTCALAGATAVLATSLRGPLTGLILMAEFTGQPTATLVPLSVAVAAAFATAWLRPALPGVTRRR